MVYTAKVSQEWMDLTLGSIKKVESCHVLILDHLAEIINQQSNTNYTWVSLLTLMPRLVHLECLENTEAFWREISPICHQLKVLDCKPRKVDSFDWKQLDISLQNLVELRWDGSHEGAFFLFRIFELAPKLDKITLKRLKINTEWKNKIPKSVKHILLKDVQFLDEQQCSIYNLCEDTSTLETFSANYGFYFLPQRTNFFDAKGLKKLELSHPQGSKILQDALQKCPNLETVCNDLDQIYVTDSWHKSIPASVKLFKSCGMSVEENIRHHFSFDWLFQNYGALQSLEVKFLYCRGVNPEKFYPPKNIKKLSLGNYLTSNEDDDPFSGICFHMIGGSHLMDVELDRPEIDESWRQIFPPTVKRLKLDWFLLSNEAKEVFSPQFICENPSNIEFLYLQYFGGDLPAMDLNAFSGMNKLQELHLITSCVSCECLQSILTHCLALTNLFILRLFAGALTNIPHNLVLPSLRTLDVKESLGQPSLLLQHFPKMRQVHFTFIPTKECWLEIMHCLQRVETAKIKIIEPSFRLLWSLIENIDDTKFKYLCLSVKVDIIFTFYLTKSLLYACTDLDRFYGAPCVVWIKNYPTSPLLSERMSNIPSSTCELLRRYDNIMGPEDGSDDDENDE